MRVCAAATPERIVRQKRFMGKLEKLYMVSPPALVLPTVCYASFMLILYACQHFEHARHAVVPIKQQSCITCSDRLLCSTVPAHVLLKCHPSCLSAQPSGCLHAYLKTYIVLDDKHCSCIDQQSTRSVNGCMVAVAQGDHLIQNLLRP